MKIRAPFRRETNAVEKAGKFSEVCVKPHGILATCPGSAWLIFSMMELLEANDVPLS